MHFYGYLFELGDPKTGHQALRQVLNSPYVDVLCSPVGYLDRLAGGALSLMAPVDSVHAHGKLWMVEDDTKTHLEPPSTEDYGDPFNHRIETAWDTAMIHKRNMAVILSRGLGVWWMDLWSHGWLRDEGIWENIESLCAFYQAYLPQLKGGYSPEVAVVGDEDGIKAFRDPWNQAKAVLQQNMPALYRSGVSFGLYLLDDVLDGRAAADCKLYIIIGAYRLTRDKAERLKAACIGMARRCCGSMGPTRRRGPSVRRSPGSVQRRYRGKGVPCWRAVIPRRTRTPSRWIRCMR